LLKELASFARPEYKEKLKEMMEFLKNTDKFEKKAEVKLHGLYLNSNEYTVYLILEADNYIKISNFLSSEPILTHHTAKITPVVTLEETLEFARKVTEEQK
jgi:muconolactone delta-isomerase